jgi:hypothetical protein
MLGTASPGISSHERLRPVREGRLRLYCSLLQLADSGAAPTREALFDHTFGLFSGPI